MTKLAPPDQQALERAVELLDRPRLAIRVANMAGRPLEGAIGAMPGMSSALHAALRKGILNCLTIAVESQEGEDFAPSTWRAKALAGLSGGIGGLFGAFALPLEMPLTLTLMLRGIADIARDQGEDLRDLEPRLACLQVFALGSGKSETAAMISYYTTRATLNKLTIDVVSSFAQRSTLDASAPVVTRLVAELVGRLGLVLSERAAVGAVPILGAIGGATLNVAFMDHFQRVAEGHFTLRRLERAHGREEIRALYSATAAAAVARG